MKPYRILTIDDEPHIREVLRYALEKEGFIVLEAENGKEGLEKAQQLKPDVIILDIMMPEMHGLDVCRVLRNTQQTPILFLSSKDSEVDRILGLELGGDDYMTKPFSPRELVARINVMVRRLQQIEGLLSSNNDVLQHGNLKLNPQTYQVFWKGSPVTLTATEFNLLALFLQSPQRVYTRDALIQADIFKDIISDRTIDSHIRRLRQKLAASGCEGIIETVHGFGYKLGAPC